MAQHWVFLCLDQQTFGAAMEFNVNVMEIKFKSEYSNSTVIAQQTENLNGR